MESSLNKAATIISKETPIGLMFSSQKPRIEIQVLDTKVIISNFDYVGFEQFNSQLKEICVGISNFIPRKEVKKVGLRKISSIIIDPVHSYQDACAIFNPALFANVRSGLIKQETLKAHEEVSVIEREDNICVIRAQLKKTSSATSYEACLDFDFVSLASCDIEEVFTSKLPELNDNHFDLFMWAASDDLIKLMEESK